MGVNNFVFDFDLDFTKSSDHLNHTILLEKFVGFRFGDTLVSLYLEEPYTIC